MKKYKIKYNFKENIPCKINELMLNLLFFDAKNSFLHQYPDFEKEKSNNNFFLSIMMQDMGNTENSKKNKYYKKHLSKFKTNFLMEKYIITICNALHAKDYDMVNKLLKSFIYSKLVKNAKLITDDKQPYIILTLDDDTNVSFKHIPIDKELVEAYAGQCYQVTSYFVKASPTNRNGVMVMRENELFGKYYHCFMVENDVVYDLSHNIMISYKNYIKLFNPKIILNENGNELIRNMQEIYNKEKFSDEERWSDLAVYGILKS